MDQNILSTRQKTLLRSVSMKGIGLHSGQEILLTLRAAPPNVGIWFRRVDLPGQPEISARHSSVFSTQMATSLSSGKTVVGTVEHLMAAFYGFGIDNAYVDLNGPEVPVFDGSAKVFSELLDAAGVSVQEAPKQVLVLKHKVELRVSDKWAVAEPAPRFELHATIDWDHPAIGFQEFHYFEGRTPFRDVLDARTFGFLNDVERLKAMGLARGGSLANAIVLDDAGVLNPDGLRSPDEFVRHKVLDALGDLKLAGADICASIRLHRGGHELHSQLLNKIYADKDCFELVPADQLSRELPTPDAKRPSRPSQSPSSISGRPVWGQSSRSSRLAAV